MWHSYRKRICHRHPLLNPPIIILLSKKISIQYMRISRSRLMGENRSINVKLRLPPLCHQPQHNTSSHFTTTTNIIVIHNTYCCAITTMTTTSTATQYIIMPISHTHTDNMKPQLRRKIHPETTPNNNHQHNCIFLVGFFIILLIIFQEIVL